MMHDIPKISVVLTSFNGAKFIEQQLNSILNQTLLPDEIIVCDDGSTDGTIQILQAFNLKHNITILLNPSQLGVLQNFKTAVALAKPANYIALCDQDDIWLPNKLTSNWEAMQQLQLSVPSPNEPCLVYSDLAFMNENGIVINTSFYNQMGLDKFTHCFDTALFGSLLLGCTIFINPAMRSEFIAMPNSKIFFHDAWLALLGFGIGHVHFINTPLVKYRLHDNNLSLQKFKKRNRFVNALGHIGKALFKTNYLEKEVALAKVFHEKYYSKLSSNKQLLLDAFLSLSGKLYFQKKWAFEKAFKNKWIKRF
jgi:glycosyltransferase involved in cell wall biosynthesis